MGTLFNALGILGIGVALFSAFLTIGAVPVPITINNVGYVGVALLPSGSLLMGSLMLLAIGVALDRLADIRYHAARAVELLTKLSGQSN